MLMLNADAGDGVVRRRKKTAAPVGQGFFVLGLLGQRREGREEKGRARGLPAVRTVNLNKRERRREEQGRGRRTDHGKAATVFLVAHFQGTSTGTIRDMHARGPVQVTWLAFPAWPWTSIQVLLLFRPLFSCSSALSFLPRPKYRGLHASTPSTSSDFRYAKPRAV